jgi:GntR family transcriptional regulator, transcriptional repressor for pyruvate dehydrogenase complex
MRVTARKADEVAQDLLERIVSGELRQGSLLPRETDLADRYGVARNVVREANKLLEVHRLVHPVKPRGTEVLDPLQSMTPEVLRAMLAGREGRIDRAMLREFLEIRAVLDSTMARLAAERRTEEDLAELERCLRRLEEPARSDDPLGYHGVIDDLALAIAGATHNRIFVMLVHWHRQIARDLDSLLRPVRAAAWESRGYHLLVDTIRRGDAELAEQLVGRFHEWSNQRLLEEAAIPIGEPDPCSD